MFSILYILKTFVLDAFDMSSANAFDRSCKIASLDKGLTFRLHQQKLSRDDQFDEVLSSTL